MGPAKIRVVFKILQDKNVIARRVQRLYKKDQSQNVLVFKLIDIPLRNMPM